MHSDRTLTALGNILRNIDLAEQFTRDIPIEQFIADNLRLYATIRVLEIVSEASRRVPDDVKKKASGGALATNRGGRKRLSARLRRCRCGGNLGDGADWFHGPAQRGRGRIGPGRLALARQHDKATGRSPALGISDRRRRRRTAAL